jgi:hypothetical protein
METAMDVDTEVGVGCANLPHYIHDEDGVRYDNNGEQGCLFVSSTLSPGECIPTYSDNTSSAIPCASCGLKGHQRTSHRDCSFNTE